MITLTNVSKTVTSGSENLTILHAVDLSIPGGQFVAVVGPSGSGKSFFTNHMVRSYYEQGTHIVLVDVGHSYKGLCDLVKGYYFTYSETKPIKFNPFFIC